ncbi:MAG: M28 family peptidase [SAR324 cluster bacterium]|nr:M28 family peptidase [SAR324 cluster bacterium]
MSLLDQIKILIPIVNEQMRNCQQNVRGFPVKMVCWFMVLSLAGCSDSGSSSSGKKQTSSQIETVNMIDAGTTTLAVMRYLSEFIGQRTAGSEQEASTKNYIIQELTNLGYEPEQQQFKLTGNNSSLNQNTESYNIIVTKQGNGSYQLILGAHYDSVGVGTGAIDNASGAGALIELAGRLKDNVLPYTLVFVFFGAEEAGLLGSHAYVAQMPASQCESIIGMLNFDTIAGGDYLYVHGDASGYLREQALSLAAYLGYDVRTNPGKNPEYPQGTTGSWSDHAPFHEVGIPYGVIEATNWDIGEKDGYTQTVEQGTLWHTSKDSLTFIESAFPRRIEQQLETVISLVTHLLINLELPENWNNSQCADKQLRSLIPVGHKHLRH